MQYRLLVILESPWILKNVKDKQKVHGLKFNSPSFFRILSKYDKPVVVSVLLTKYYISHP